MLFLLFQVGDDRYAIEAAATASVVPLVELKRMPHAPAGVVGAFNHRGTPVPVIDLSLLMLGRPAAQMLSTRILLVHYPAAERPLHLLGLIAELATETMRAEPDDFVPAGVASDGAPYLGPVLADGGGLIQRVTVERLLPPALHDALFRMAAEV